MDFKDLEQERIAISCVLSSFTTLACDLLELIPEDVALLREHKIRLPTLVYLGARLTTVGFIILAFVSTKIISCKLSVLTTAFFTSARGLTSLRVHALYTSNQTLQLLLVLALVGVTVSCAVMPRLSGLTSALFDFAVFVAIVWKLGWRPSVRKVRRNTAPDGSGEVEAEVEVEVYRRFWFPLRRRPDPEHQLIDRVLQDSLIYIVLAISMKVPQIFYFANRSPCSRPKGYWQNYSIFLDVIGMCTISCKIFRDMKLGSSASLDSNRELPPDVSVLVFGSNPGQTLGSEV